MAMASMNVQMDEAVKEQAESIFRETGLDISSAINLFLKTTVREHRLPFTVQADIPNDTTAAAIEEGRRIAVDEKARGYSSMEALKAALEA